MHANRKLVVSVSSMADANGSVPDSMETPTHVLPPANKKHDFVHGGEITGSLADVCNARLFLRVPSILSENIFHMAVILYLARPEQSSSLRRNGKHWTKILSYSLRRLLSVHTGPLFFFAFLSSSRSFLLFLFSLKNRKWQ